MEARPTPDSRQAKSSRTSRLRELNFLQIHHNDQTKVTPSLETANSAKMSASASKSKPTIAPGHNQYAPLSILDTDTARLYSHIHPVVVISGYLVQFRAIVANPVSTLTALLFPLIILQILYAVLCLPPTGTSTTPATPKAGASKGGRKKAAKKDDITLSQRIVVCTVIFITQYS